jgi:hypothetical protein
MGDISGIYSVTSTSVHYVFPQGRWFAVPPCLFITLYGVATDIDRTFNYETINGASVITSVDITFQAGAVGKQFSLLIVSNDG